MVRKKNVFRWGAALLAAVLTCCLFGCVPSPQAEKTRVTLMHGWGSTATDHVAMRKIYNGFAQKHPEIELVFDMSPDLDVVIEKAKDMLATARMPDVISTNGHAVVMRHAAQKGYALNLMPYLDQDADFREDIPDIVFDSWGTPDGGLYTVSDVLEVIGYWYNAEIFRKAGVEEPPRTWQDFWLACEKIRAWSQETEAGVYPLIMEREQALNSLVGARIAGENAEGEAFMRTAPLSFDTPEVRNALQEAARAFGYAHPDSFEFSTRDAQYLFLQGRGAIYFNGVWANTAFPGDMEIRPAAFPGDGGRQVSYVSASCGYVIGSLGGEARADACVELLKYLLSDEVQLQILTETRQAPANPNLPAALIREKVPLLGEALEAAYGADIQIRTLRSLWPEDAVTVLGDNIRGYCGGEIDSGEFIAMLNAKLN